MNFYLELAYMLLEEMIPLDQISLMDVKNKQKAENLFKTSSDFAEAGISSKSVSGLWNYIIYNNKPVGLIVVTIIDQQRRRIGKIDSVVIKDEYRGMGLLRGELLLFDKYDLDLLVATIKDYLSSSSKAHLKLGFKKHKPDIDWHEYILHKKDISK